MRILWDICERCGKFIPHEIDWLKGIWRPKGYVEGEVEKTLSPNQIVEILKEAYVRCRKYKDGVKTKDRWLQAEIYDVLSENWIRYGKPPLYIVSPKIVKWGIENGILKVVKEVHYDIPYAYRKHGWRGIKVTIAWLVLELNQT